MIADHPAEPLHIRFLPFPVMSNFLVREAFLFVFGGIVHAVAQIVVQKRR